MRSSGAGTRIGPGRVAFAVHRKRLTSRGNVTESRSGDRNKQQNSASLLDGARDPVCSKLALVLPEGLGSRASFARLGTQIGRGSGSTLLVGPKRRVHGRNTGHRGLSVQKEESYGQPSSILGTYRVDGCCVLVGFYPARIRRGA